MHLVAFKPKRLKYNMSITANMSWRSTLPTLETREACGFALAKTSLIDRTVGVSRIRVIDSLYAF